MSDDEPSKKRQRLMKQERRFLNVEFGGLCARIRIVTLEDISEIQDAIKAKFGSDLDAPPARIQLYASGSLIATWKELMDLPHDYFVEQSLALSVQVSSKSPAKKLKSFWMALKNIDVSEIRGEGVIRLPENTFILGHRDLGSTIFIRPCYPSFLDVVMGIIDNQRNPQNLAILGNPGIGKTFFGYFLLLHLSRSGRTVVYQAGKNLRYLFSPTSIAIGSSSDFYGELESEDTYYIVYAAAPELFAARTVLLSSPRLEIYHDFRKKNYSVRFMPVWTLNELQKCRDLLYDDPSGRFVSKADVDSLFKKWGGIARYVLEYASSAYQQGLLGEALVSSKLASNLESIGESDAPPEISSRIVHLFVDKDFNKGAFQFASDYVADRVYDRLFEVHRNFLMTFISARKGIGVASVLRGALFERYTRTVHLRIGCIA